MKNTCIALAQFLAEPGKTTENAQKIFGYLQTASEQEAELILFPECSLTGYSSNHAGEISIDRNDPRIQRIRNAGKNAGIAVCFGYVEREGNVLYITQELTAGGDSLYYRKTHLGSKEKVVFQEGNEFPVFETPVCTGIQLCWESHIPEISSIERKKGAELLLIPYASPMSKDKCCENWNIHLPARASDNGVYAAACNLLFPAAEGSEELRGGGMAVYDPKGKRILEYFGPEEKMMLCEMKGPLPRESAFESMHNISYFDRKRTELFNV